VNDTPEHDQETELDADIGETSEAYEGDDNGLGPIDALIAERDQWKDRALRAVAEAENTNKRAETQNNDARAYAIQKFARDLLVVSDNLERALQAAPKDADQAAAGLISGLELTHKALLQAFEGNNLRRVAPEPGEAFDPHLHQAMMEQPSDTVQGGQVLQTLQPGYALFGRTVRPAMVVVAAKGSGAATGNAAYSAAQTTGGNFDGKA
jgi:molecular chaperone GrpE